MDRAESIARSLEFLRTEYNTKATKSLGARWYVTGDSNGLESATLQNTDADFVTVRGRYVMEGVKPKEVMELIINCVNRTEWDDALKQGMFAKDYGKLTTSTLPPCSADIIRLIYKGVYPVSSRDLCLLRAWGEDDDGKCWLVAESCEDASVPLDSNCVRAELRECGYMMTPTASGCEVVYISQTNFNGYIPIWMQNTLTKQQPTSLLAMEGVLNRKLIGA